jgi:hypothetical protein
MSIIVFTGCVNKRGISTKYYNDCREYYDASGYYHKVCDDNIIEFEDVKNSTAKTYESAKKKLFNEEYVEPEHKVVW